MEGYRAGPILILFLFLSTLGCDEDSTSVPIQRKWALSDSSFVVGDASVLEVNNFAGSVHVQAGDPGEIRVVAKKWAGSLSDLDRIEIEMVQVQDSVRVVTTQPQGLNNLSVDLEITIPPDTRPALLNGAGEISYEGLAEGDSRFAVGAGSITLILPADVNVEVNLSVGAGSIHLDFTVEGVVSEQVVTGIIGTGEGGRINAQVGAGTITVIPQ